MILKNILGQKANLSLFIIFLKYAFRDVVLTLFCSLKLFYLCEKHAHPYFFNLPYMNKSNCVISILKSFGHIWRWPKRYCWIFTYRRKLWSIHDLNCMIIEIYFFETNHVAFLRPNVLAYKHFGTINEIFHVLSEETPRDFNSKRILYIQLKKFPNLLRID